MTREEVIAIMKESITLYIDEETSFYGDTRYLTVKLLVDGEVLTHDTVSFRGG